MLTVSYTHLLIMTCIVYCAHDKILDNRVTIRVEFYIIANCDSGNTAQHYTVMSACLD